MEATSNQIQQLQIACTGKFRDRSERLEAVSDIIGLEIDSFTELSTSQADELIYFFKTGKLPDNRSFAFFDFNNMQHRTILSLCHTLGWKEDDSNRVDLNRLGGWLKSNRSPVRKPLKEMNKQELSKIISALESIIRKKYK